VDKDFLIGIAKMAFLVYMAIGTGKLTRDLVEKNAPLNRFTSQITPLILAITELTINIA